MKQRFSKRTRLVSALLTLAMVCTFLPFSAFAAGGTHAGSTIELSSSNFPDDAFREYLKKFDINHDNKLASAERNAVKEIDVRSKNISNLYGIQFFPNLKSLICSNNQLTSLDVHENTALEYLACTQNKLTSLDVSNNTALDELYCYRNQLTSLDVRQNTQLKVLGCSENQLTSLDVSQNTALEYLACRQNKLASLDVSQTAVRTLDARGNQIDINVEETPRTFDLSTLPGFNVNRASGWNGGTVNGNILTVNAGATKVTYDYYCGKGRSETFTLNVKVVPDGTVTPPSGKGIRIYGENFPNYEFRRYLKDNIDKNADGYLDDTELNIRKLDVSGQYIANLKGIEFFPNLETLYCFNNKLTSLDVSYNTKLQELYCQDNKLTSLDVSKNTKLETLWCSQNQLKKLDVSKNTALKILSCEKNLLTSLDVSWNTALEKLYCSQNQLTKLDVSKNSALWHLSCDDNQLTKLDVSQNQALKNLSCHTNQLTKLDVSKNTKLEKLWCYQNQLTELDVSQTAVTELKASGNQIDINIEETPRTFDLSTLPGFDVTKAANWSGGTVSGKTLKVNEGTNQVTYTYDCGKGFSRDFTLNVKVVPDGTVTPPSGGDNPGGTTPGGSTPGGSTPGGSTGGDGGGAIVIVAAAGAAVAGVVGYGVYNYVSGQKLQALLPEGVAAPENRAQTALLLWNTAGRPEPAEAPAFADVADPDTAKAAQWCVEQGLMKRRLNGKFAPGSSIPAYQVLNAYRKLAGG